MDERTPTPARSDQQALFDDIVAADLDAAQVAAVRLYVHQLMRVEWQDTLSKVRATAPGDGGMRPVELIVQARGAALAHWQEQAWAAFERARDALFRSLEARRKAGGPTGSVDASTGPPSTLRDRD